jgi:hypothetical protein
MVLIEHDCVEPSLLSEKGFVEIFVLKLRALFRVEELVGQAEKTAVFDDLVLGDIAIRTLGKVHQYHGI